VIFREILTCRQDRFRGYSFLLFASSASLREIISLETITMEQPDFSIIKDGDILLSHYIGNWFKYPLDTLITKRICAYTNSLYSHAAVIFSRELFETVPYNENNSTGLIVTEAVAKGLVINNFEKYLDEKRYRITIIRILKKVETQCVASLSDNQRLFPISLNNNPRTPFNKGDNTPLTPLKRGIHTPSASQTPLSRGELDKSICGIGEINLAPQCNATFMSQKSEMNLASQRCEALTDEMRAKMREIAFNIINLANNYYDKKLLILIALAIRLWGKNGYENGMNYLRCHYDNFWICSEWVQYLYAQVGIKFTNTNRLLAPEDLNRYENKKVIFSNL